MSPDGKKDSDSDDRSQVHHDKDGSSKPTFTQSSSHSGSLAATLKHPTKGRVGPHPKSAKGRKNAGRRESNVFYNDKFLHKKLSLVHHPLNPAAVSGESGDTGTKANFIDVLEGM